MKGFAMHSMRIPGARALFACVLIALAGACSSSSEDDADLELSLDDKKAAKGASSAVKGEDANANANANDLSADPEGLSLPRRFDLASMQRFLKEHADAAGGERAMRKEYQVFFQTLSVANSVDAAETAPLAFRLQENTTAAHWALVYGVYELVDLLQQTAVSMLQEDRERNFVSRMRTLVFLARELDKNLPDSGYTPMVRSVYTDLSQRYFDRKLEPRKLKQSRATNARPAPR